MSQIIAMSERLQEYERIIETLKEKISWTSDSPPDLKVGGGDTSSEKDIDNTVSTATSGHDSTQQEQTPALPLSDLSLDENGKVRSTDNPLPFAFAFKNN